MFEQLAQFVKRIFAAPSKAQSVQQEMLVRSRVFKSNYKNWLSQGGHTEILKNLYTAYTLNKLGITGEVPMQVFVNGSSRHVLLHYTDSMGNTLFPFLQDYFRNRIMQIGYSVSLSDRQLVSRAAHAELIERHMLKPNIQKVLALDKKEQLYGLITISVHAIDDRPLYLQISAEAIQNNQYNAAFSFDELAEAIFQ